MTIGTNSNGDGNPKCDERSLRHPRRALCRIGATLRRFLSGALETYGIWHRLRADQRALLEMDGRMLRDIGITRYDALREARQSLLSDFVRELRKTTRRTSAGAQPVLRCCPNGGLDAE